MTGAGNASKTLQTFLQAKWWPLDVQLRKGSIPN